MIKNIRNKFFETTKEIFKSQLSELVLSGTEILNRCNKVLNGMSSSNTDLRTENYERNSNQRS